eukprot:m.439718 g.439718  ORF g.439718 m.439718 type:complete len:714 (-) comp21456_c0_seq1:136-2277(-)
MALRPSLLSVENLQGEFVQNEAFSGFHDTGRSTVCGQRKDTPVAKPAAQLRFRNTIGNTHHHPLNFLDLNFQETLSQVKAQLETYLERHGIDHVYNIVGHGSHNQIKNETEMQQKMTSIARMLDARHGKHRWALVYGGDNYQPGKPDIAAIVRYFWAAHGTRVIAVQCTDYANWMVNQDGSVQDGTSYDFLDAAIVYKSEKNRKGKIKFGGYDYDNVSIVGTTRYVLGPLFKQALRGMIVCGGGLISLNELQEFVRRGYRCIYVPVEAKYKIVDTSIADENSDYAKFGLVQKWVDDVGIPIGKWVRASSSDTSFDGNSQVLYAGDQAEQDAYVKVHGKGAKKYNRKDQWKVWTARDDQTDVDCVIDTRKSNMQDEIEIGLSLTQLLDIRDQDNTCQFTFQLHVKVEGTGPNRKTDWFFPALYFRNCTGELTPPWDRNLEPDFVHHELNGRHFYVLNKTFEGTFTQRFQLQAYPYDTQVFSILLLGPPVEQARLIRPSGPSVAMYADADIEPNWAPIVLKKDSSGLGKGDTWCGVDYGVTKREYDRNDISYRKVECRVALQRIPDSILWNILVPTLFLSMGCMLVFSTDPAETPDRLSLGFTILLTLVALKIVFMDTLPQLAYLTFAETYVLAQSFYVLLVSTYAAVINESDNIQTALDDPNVDQYNLMVAAGIFLVLQLVFTVWWYRIRCKRNAFLSRNNVEICYPANNDGLI